MTDKYIIFSAPSGSGKTTIVKRLLESNLNLKFSVSACSRPKRAGETEGVDYYYLTPEEFKNRISVGDFLEWEEVYTDRFYGTLKSEVERLSTLGFNVVFDVDVVGGIDIKKYYGQKALALFIMPPSIQELERRLRSRATDSEADIVLRLAKAEKEMKYADQFDLVIVNDDLEVAVKQTYNSIKQFILT